MVYIIKYIQVNKKRGSKYMERKQAKDLQDRADTMKRVAKTNKKNNKKK